MKIKKKIVAMIPYFETKENKINKSGVFRIRRKILVRNGENIFLNNKSDNRKIFFGRKCNEVRVPHYVGSTCTLLPYSMVLVQFSRAKIRYRLSCVNHSSWVTEIKKLDLTMCVCVVFIVQHYPQTKLIVECR